MMNNNMSNPTNHDARISCEEVFTEDMGPATWANAPTQPTEPTEADYDEANARCEDAPCCGCCPSSNDYSADDGYGSPAADAWHDAHEYPEW